MLLKDAIRYYELTGCDFQNDLKDFGKLQRNFIQGYIQDDFTEKYESFTDKLLILWTDRQGGVKQILEENIELPNHSELISLYCRTIGEVKESEVETEIITFDDDLLKKHKKDRKENTIVELISAMTAVDIDITQFLDMELELVYQILEIVGEKRKKEQEKAKKQRRRV
ncbi:hypothetical protein [Lactococcus ileimucosae]|uniref:hypothetical protein n=1 Tax=Lactococcus ileimucosae TaxID=2941329 RepID=UPI003510D703